MDGADVKVVITNGFKWKKSQNTKYLLFGGPGKLLFKGFMTEGMR